jgi:hypothetical protein
MHFVELQHDYNGASLLGESLQFLQVEQFSFDCHPKLKKKKPSSECDKNLPSKATEGKSSQWLK